MRGPLATLGEVWPIDKDMPEADGKLSRVCVHATVIGL